MNQLNKKQVKSLLFFIPFGFLVIGIILLVRYLGRRGLLGAVGDLVGIEQTGASKSVEQSQSVVQSYESQLSASGFSISNEHKLVANQLFALINESHLNPFSSRFWSQDLYTDTQLQIVALLLDYYQPITDGDFSNLKAIIAAYGVRVANNRQNAFLGFIWDNTKGNLYDHLSWYLDDKLPTYNKYSSGDEPANVKSVILSAIKVMT